MRDALSRRRAAALVAAAALGAAVSVLPACGEDRGGVSVEGGTGATGTGQGAGGTVPQATGATTATSP